MVRHPMGPDGIGFVQPIDCRTCKGGDATDFDCSCHQVEDEYLDVVVVYVIDFVFVVDGTLVDDFD